MFFNPDFKTWMRLRHGSYIRWYFRIGCALAVKEGNKKCDLLKLFVHIKTSVIIFFFKKDLIAVTRAQRVLSYHLI